MKNILLLSCALISSASYAMDASEQKESTSLSTELTDVEQKSFDWFEKTAKQLPSTTQLLSQEDQEVIQKLTKYDDHPQEVTRSRHNYVRTFLAQAQEAHIPIEYNEDTIFSALLKVTKKLQTPSTQKPT